MLQERVSADIYVFTSDLYAQTTAGVVVTPEGAIVVDTLPFPDEARELGQFVADGYPAGPSYVILTHYHADHTYGAFVFPQGTVVVGHAHCRSLLATRGEEGLAAARAEAPELEEVTLRLPNITFDGEEMALHLGGRTLRLIWTPGHSKDMVSVLVEEEGVLFAGDTLMPVPTIVDGDLETLKRSLIKIMDLMPGSIVQGHGEVILRGEVRGTIQAGLAYLDTIHDIVAEAVREGRGRETLLDVGIERCGLSRVALNGHAPSLHTANLLALYDRMRR